MFREVYVLERNGIPVRAEIDFKPLSLVAEAGRRTGVPFGEQQVIRYKPESEPMWLFQANKDWTETQLTAASAPIQEILQQDVDGGPWTFSLHFLAPDWDAAKRLMDEMQGHRAGSFVESIVPPPPKLKERRKPNKLASKYVPGKPKHRWKEAGWKVPTIDDLILDHDLPDGAEFVHGKVCKRCGQIKRTIRFPKINKCQSQYRHSNGVWFFGNKVCVK